MQIKLCLKEPLKKSLNKKTKDSKTLIRPSMKSFKKQKILKLKTIR